MEQTKVKKRYKNFYIPVEYLYTPDINDIVNNDFIYEDVIDDNLYELCVQFSSTLQSYRNDISDLDFCYFISPNILYDFVLRI